MKKFLLNDELMMIMKLFIAVLSVMILMVACDIGTLTSRVIYDTEAGDDILFEKAIKNNDHRLCLEIEYSIREEECLISIAKATKNQEVCGMINNIRLREACLEWVYK
jgi:hypothetical protein